MKSIVVLLTLFCLCQGQNSGCPPNWTRFRDRCYFISNDFVEWDDAMDKCRKMNSILAPPLTCDAHINLNAFLVRHRGKCCGEKCTTFWIGLYSPYSNQASYTDPRKMEWTTPEGIDFAATAQCQFWGKNPKVSGICAFMSYEDNGKKGVWNAKPCNESRKYVCITCPNNFDYLPDVNECIYLNTKKMNWKDARMACTKLKSGAQLLTIKTPQKSLRLSFHMHDVYRKPEYAACFDGKVTALDNPAWTGGQTKQPKICGTPYVWKPVRRPEQFLEYTAWIPGSPDCGSVDENCLAIATKMNPVQWHDMVCSEELCSFCEF